MSWWRPIGYGLRTAWRRRRLVGLVYLSTLLPTLLVALLAAGRIGGPLTHSLFARQALAGNRLGPWTDLLTDPATGMAAVWGALRLTAVAMVAVQALIAAGVVEGLLGRTARGAHPFALGVATHGWRFLRSTLWLGGALVALGVLLAAAFRVINDQAPDGRIQLYGWVVTILALGLLYALADLACDLSRIAAASHFEGRTFLGFFRALFHALRRAWLLLPLWLVFVLGVVALHLAYVLGRAAVAPTGLAGVLLLLLAQQLVFLLAAYLRVGLWSAEIAYYQGAGEPHWCGRRARRRAVRRRAPAGARVTGAA